MNRPSIHCVIPVERESSQLDKTVDLISRNTNDFDLTVSVRPDLNVSEARQQVMDTFKDRYLCFLDYDSEMVTPGWLDAMFQTMQKRGAGVVFGHEKWGTDERFHGVSIDDCIVDHGPAACMLLDRSKIPAGVKWNADIGLRNGWLGGDFEEVEYCRQLQAHEVLCWMSGDAFFHHTGGRTTMRDFQKTDRQKTVIVMSYLIDHAFVKHSGDADFFKGLQYVKADRDNDLMLAPGSTLRQAYREVFRRNGLLHKPLAKKYGIE